MTVKTLVVFARVPCAGRLRPPRRGDRYSQQRRHRTLPNADAHKEDANTVEVDEGMLRDLRITTRPSNPATGGELVMLLGELAVDQRGYAEVGTPVAARVTRLLVDVGDAVRSGQTLAELTSPELGRERAEYLSASARLTLAEAALERKRGLAAEKIVPLREVQEAESAAGEARAALRASRAAIAAFGVEPPANDGDGATSSAFVLRSPVAGSVIERTAVAGSDAGPGGAGVPHRQPLDAVADRSRLRARRRSHSSRVSLHACRFPPFQDRTSRAR